MLYKNKEYNITS